MKKICLVLSFIICLLCFVGCKNNNQDVVNPNVPENPNQEQSGEKLPDEGEDVIISSGEETPDQELSGEISDDEPDITIPDDGNETLDNGENVEKPGNNEEVENPDDKENTEISTPTASGASNIMTNIVTKAGAEVNAPMQDAITAESSEGFIFLPEADFTKYVTDGVFYESMMSPSHQSLCIIKVNDTSKIAELKSWVLSQLS